VETKQTQISKRLVRARAVGDGRRTISFKKDENTSSQALRIQPSLPCPLTPPPPALPLRRAALSALTTSQLCSLATTHPPHPTWPPELRRLIAAARRCALPQDTAGGHCATGADAAREGNLSRDTGGGASGAGEDTAGGIGRDTAGGTGTSSLDSGGGSSPVKTLGAATAKSGRAGFPPVELGAGGQPLESECLLLSLKRERNMGPKKRHEVNRKQGRT
jgi:hypothetical protein